MSKKIVFFIVLFNLISINSICLSDIIPLKKPFQSKQETQKKLLIDILRPLPKPIKQSETKKIEKKIVVKKDKKNEFILPKKKPLISGSEISGSKKTADVKISKYYSKKDFSIGRKAILEMQKGRWSSSLKVAKKAKDFLS